MVGVTADSRISRYCRACYIPCDAQSLRLSHPRVGQSDVAGVDQRALEVRRADRDQSGRSVGMFFPATPGYVPLVRFCGDFTAVP